jgi:hypothetical protein
VISLRRDGQRPASRLGRWAGTPPTGRTAEFSGVNIFRFGADGKVIEIWNHRDELGPIEQLGAPVFAGAAPTEAL